MAATNASLNINFTSAGLTELVNNLNNASTALQRMGKEYQGASTSAKLMEDIIQSSNKAVAFINTHMRSDGTMDLAAAKELTKMLEQITSKTMTLDKVEKQRLSPDAYKTQHDALVKNNADYQNILETLKQLNQQKDDLAKKEGNLKSGNAETIFNELGVKGNAYSKKILPKLASLTDKQLNDFIPSANARKST